MNPVVNPMATIITNVGLIVTAAVDWVSTTVGAITASGNELIYFSAIFGFVGVGISLLRRMFKLHV